MTRVSLYIAVALQALAIAYGIHLMLRRWTAASAWIWLVGAMLAMLTWRLVILTGTSPSPLFNTIIAVWGSTCMLAAMYQFGREVFRREQAESARDALLESERVARSEAERASRLKDEFLATVSHELRTPLAAILSWCDLIVLERDNSHGRKVVDVDHAFEVIARNARAQARLVDDLLDMTRIQAGALRLDVAAVSLDAPVGAALDAIRPAAEAKRIRIEVACDASPPVVEGDVLRLQQIAMNLLVNAVKFTPEGGTITIVLRRSGGRAEFVVGDDGEGIEPEFLPSVFTRFRQADNSTARRQGGLGLGLAIVESLVELQGGTVHASSDGIGKGSRFTVSFPLSSSPVAARPVESVQRPLPHDASRTVRVLVVDDDADIRAAVSGLLEQEGCQVTCLASAADVVHELANVRPHLLVCDIGMPGEDGYQLIERIRRMRASDGGNIPAIALTAHARGEDRGRALESGFDAHLAKPIDSARLRETVRQLTSVGSASDD